MTDLVDGRGRRAATPGDPQPHPRPRPRILSDPELNAYRPTLWTRVRGVGALTLAADVTACLLGWLGSGASPRPALLLLLLIVGLFLGSRLYDSRLNMAVLDDLPAIAGRWVIACSLVAITGAALEDRPISDVTSEPELLLLPGLVLTLIILGRAVTYAVIRWARRSGRVGHRVLVLGAGVVGHELARLLQDHPQYGLRPYCFLDADPKVVDSVSTLPVLGDPELLEQTLVEHRIHVVIVAFSAMKESDMVPLIRTCDRLEAELFVVPRLFELHHVEGDMDTVWGVPLVRLRRAAYRSPMWRVKRLADILMSGLALLVLSPVMALLALGVRLDGGPGIIFRQERVGVDGRPVQVMKFRSMRPVNEAESQTNWNIANDKRVSRFGKFIRKTSLDELPQLINILRGEMSVVGPRPERPYFVSQFQEMYPSYGARHRVPCGLTGWAAVNGLRGDTSIADRARFDNYYIQNWSLWLDVKIILRTVSAVVTGAGG
ncbi:sugar transferase [Arsenicicoccus dermatophilus]|uniref:sugar transferase n=1 Tax=Arsenicicoccus dermatophilus TaxID=1076331 RepID=UPI003916E73E